MCFGTDGMSITFASLLLRGQRMSCNMWAGNKHLKANLSTEVGMSLAFGCKPGQILAAHLLYQGSWCSGLCLGQGCQKSWRVYSLTLGTSRRRCSDSLCSSISVARAGICHLEVMGVFGLIVGICKKMRKSR